jgi:hypothetical protein
MCTVTYIPGEKNNFILGHNRDERIDRPMATPPLSRMINGQNVIYPVDPEGKGTWIGVSVGRKVVSLLNGGTKKHNRMPSYRHSRGLVIPAYFLYNGVEEFSLQYDFSGLEPFTLITVEEDRMFVLVWEDDTIKITEKNRKLPHIFFSHSLYPKNSLESRTADFYNWYLNNRDAGENDLLNYNLHQRFESDRIAKFDTGKYILKTVSISVIGLSEDITRYHYYDPLNDIHLSNSYKTTKPAFEIPGNAGVLA